MTAGSVITVSSETESFQMMELFSPGVFFSWRGGGIAVVANRAAARCCDVLRGTCGGVPSLYYYHGLRIGTRGGDEALPKNGSLDLWVTKHLAFGGRR